MRVCVDARLISGASGGLEQTIIGLAAGLGSLAGGSEEYFFLVYPNSTEWLAPYLGSNSSLLLTDSQPNLARARAAVRRTIGGRLPQAYERWQRWRRPSSPQTLPTTDGTIERASVDVVHFTTQQAFKTDVPSIYSPQDLQHRHHPEYFSAYDYAFREFTYRTWCDQAMRVISLTDWGRQDLIDAYGLAPNKVVTVPAAPVLPYYPRPRTSDLDQVRQRMALRDRFILYPAQTWPHKNHIALIDALAKLRESGIHTQLIAPGRRTAHFREIARRLADSGLVGDVLFPGFVTPLELSSLYRLCEIVVFPTTFEGWGLPVSEAFYAGRPVVCSDIQPLRELVGEAAILVDPYDPDSIARGIKRAWTDSSLQAELTSRGADRVRDLTWENTAARCREQYRGIVEAQVT